MAKRLRSEKRFAVSRKAAQETASLARTLLSLRAQLKKIKEIQARNGHLTVVEQVQANSVLQEIALTTEILAKRGVAGRLMNDSDALKEALKASCKSKPALIARSGGVGVYELGSGIKRWR